MNITREEILGLGLITIAVGVPLGSFISSLNESISDVGDGKEISKELIKPSFRGGAMTKEELERHNNA